MAEPYISWYTTVIKILHGIFENPLITCDFYRKISTSSAFNTSDNIVIKSGKTDLKNYTSIYFYFPI